MIISVTFRNSMDWSLVNCIISEYAWLHFTNKLLMQSHGNFFVCIFMIFYDAINYRITMASFSSMFGNRIPVKIAQVCLHSVAILSYFTVCVSFFTTTINKRYVACSAGDFYLYERTEMTLSSTKTSRACGYVYKTNNTRKGHWASEIDSTMKLSQLWSVMATAFASGEDLIKI